MADKHGTEPLKAAQGVLESIRLHFRELGRQAVLLMEVCGTHTMSIARAGLRPLLPSGLELLSGPGCPVCVTPTGYIDAAIRLAERPDVIITTFGDMLRVPGTRDTLESARAAGADVRIVYSPMKSLEFASQNPGRTVVFLAVGFETTAPATATLIRTAAETRTDNLTVLSAHKLIPPALRLIASDPEIRVDGFFLPGHVSVVIGKGPYEFIAKEFGRGCVITGFEPEDVLEATDMLLKQMSGGRAEVENQYRRVVRPQGNPEARRRIEEIFEREDASWRGFGRIAESGLAVREAFSRFDAARRFEVEISVEEPRTGCRCGDVLKGKMRPVECPLFAGPCTPAAPVGACMVSSEGACAASFRYERGEK
jgi:hydrogenase expression/formation protein HypD